MRMIHGTHAWTVSHVPYLYFQSDLVVDTPASRSERSRKRVLGCQTQRRNAAVTSTETSPDTTSVRRCRLALPDERYWTIAKLPPETSVAGQTSNASFQVPPSILTNSTTSQNGTRIDAHGSWWPAIVDSVSSSSPVTVASVTIGVPIAPNATGAVFAIRLSTAAWNGLKPRPTMIAPAIATGVPKPDVPSMIAPNENAISRTWSRRSNEIWMIDSLTISNFPVTTVIVYSSIAARTIQMMPTNPDRLPSANADTALVAGIPNARQETRNAATTPHSAA